MTLNSSGAISLAGTTAGQSIEIELGGTGTTQISLNDTAVRTLAGVPSGAITMPTNFYGKSNRATISYTFTSSTVNSSLNVSSIGGYVSGKSDITVTVNSGVYLWANSTGNYGLSLSGGTSGDTLKLVNNGYIMGQGGSGSYPASGSPGGPALNIGTGIGITINNASYIGGGGGSGGTRIGGGGGGAGGGAGTIGFRGLAGGGGGSIGSSGGNGATGSCCVCTFSGGGGGGRIMPGTGGGGGGGGGAGGGGGTYNGCYGAGGSGGSSGGSSSTGGGGGGGYGASGGSSNLYGGGAGGNAINKNGKAVTISSGSANIYGAIV